MAKTVTPLRTSSRKPEARSRRPVAKTSARPPPNAKPSAKPTANLISFTIDRATDRLVKVEVVEGPERHELTSAERASRPRELSEVCSRLGVTRLLGNLYARSDVRQ